MPKKVDPREGGWITAALLLIVLLVVIAGMFVYSGGYNVAATVPDSRPMRRLLSFTSDRSVHAHAGEITTVPPLGDSAQLIEGAREYDAMCAQCHAAPGHDRGYVGKGLYPRPPHLTHVFHDWNDREVFWIVKNGIKLTGMPAFGPTHDDASLWAIVAFLHRFPDMSPARYDAWVAAARRLPARGSAR